MKEFFHYLLKGRSNDFLKSLKIYSSAPLRYNEKTLSYLYSAHQILKYAKNLGGRGSNFF